MGKSNAKILLIGGGGHCKSVLDSLLTLNVYADIGIVERHGTAPYSVLGVPVVCTDEDLSRLLTDGWTHAFVTLGSIGNYARREMLYQTLTNLGFVLPIISDITATVSENGALSSGVFVGKKAVINAGSKIGACAIINSGAILEHDCSIGDFAHISPGAVLCGGVSVGYGTHIGANTVVRQQVSVGSNSIVGMGSVVLQNIPDGVVAYGNPCRVVRNV